MLELSNPFRIKLGDKMKFITTYNLSGLICYFLVKQKVDISLCMDTKPLKKLVPEEKYLIVNYLDDKILKDDNYLDNELYTLIFQDIDDKFNFNNAKVIKSKDKITSEIIFEKFNSPKGFLSLVKIDRALKDITLDNDFKRGIILNDMFYRKRNSLFILGEMGDLSLIKNAMRETYYEIEEYNQQLISEKMIQEDGNALIAFKKHHNLGHFLFYDKKELYFTYSLKTRVLHILNFTDIEIEGSPIRNGVVICDLSVKEAMNRINYILALRK